VKLLKKRANREHRQFWRSKDDLDLLASGGTLLMIRNPYGEGHSQRLKGGRGRSLPGYKRERGAGGVKRSREKKRGGVGLTAYSVELVP